MAALRWLILERVMSSSTSKSDTVVPAQVSYLTIYSPTLGRTEETLQDQIFYFHSRQPRARRRQDTAVARDESALNQQLRTIGLAQGTLQFARTFSQGQPVDYVDTEKTRLVFNELEPNWWIIASIDLTQLPPPIPVDKSQNSQTTVQAPEYSAREVSPSWLLLQQLLRAHSIFLLHHGWSLQEILERSGRKRLCGWLDKFWTKFVSHWDVLLHGNPTIDGLQGVKLAAGGELGVGVGEEEWGSGEREVLEHFVRRTEGLAELVVSRFGPSNPKNAPEKSGTAHYSPWLRSPCLVTPTDGVVFSGTGAIARHSLASLTDWVRSVCEEGEDAYGVKDNPSSGTRTRFASRKKEKRLTKRREERDGSVGLESETALPSIPLGSDKQKVVKARDASWVPPPIYQASAGTGKHDPLDISTERQASNDHNADSNSSIYKYLTLGYGSAWSFVDKSTAERNDHNAANSPEKQSKDRGKNSPQGGILDSSPNDQDVGRFLIGLHGDLGEQEEMYSDEEETFTAARTMPRNIHVELPLDQGHNDRSAQASQGESNHIRLRMVIYLSQPFVFTLLFDLDSPVLSIPAFYRSLHHQLGPLQKPLSASTDPERVNRNMQSHGSKEDTKTLPIFDLIFDPMEGTILSNIPNIPTSEAGLSDTNEPWSRLEAMNVHCQIISILSCQRSRELDFEKTCKSSKEWWVVWLRIPIREKKTEDDETLQYREAFLVRKAGDKSRHARQRFGTNQNSSSAPARLAEGIGIDTRKYIERLLNFNR
ncbi:MAG: hypothetical protein M1814_004668 [Vezdaea aestivalis]|nr:MAG: hypothetical protein M1814_004668 [Vezdaea aestivalis]